MGLCCEKGSENSASVVIDHADELVYNNHDIREIYDFGEALGQGAFGSVVIARLRGNEADRKPRAIKVISNESEGIELTYHEIDILAELSHPNVIMLYESFQDVENTYLVMEVCEGGDLFDALIDTRGLQEGQLVSVMRQVLRSVAYVHHQQIAHRDIKGENYLIQSSGSLSNCIIKLVDFGTSCHFEEGKPMRTALGTAMYLAPEVLKLNYTSKCDVWSCGVLLYLMLSGQAPFRGNDDSETLRLVRAGPLKFPAELWSGITAPAINLVRSLLERKVPSRPTAAEGLNHAWLQMEQNNYMSEEHGTELNSRLMAFCQHCTLKKIALEIMARRISEDDIGELRNMFMSIDTNGTGVIGKASLRTTLESVKVDNIEDIIQAIDGDGDGNMDYREFLAATMDAKYYHQEDVIRAVFRVFDDSDSGKIAAKDIQRVLDSGGLKRGRGSNARGSMAVENRQSSKESQKGVQAEESMSGLQAKDVLVELGKDENGQIEFEEFLDLMKGQSNQKDKRRLTIRKSRVSRVVDPRELGVSQEVGVGLPADLGPRKSRRSFADKPGRAGSFGSGSVAMSVPVESMSLSGRRSVRAHVKTTVWVEDKDGMFTRGTAPKRPSVMGNPGNPTSSQSLSFRNRNPSSKNLIRRSVRQVP